MDHDQSTLRIGTDIIRQKARESSSGYEDSEVNLLPGKCRKRRLEFPEKVEPTSIPKKSIPEASIPESSIPVSAIPEASIPQDSIPQASIPHASIPVMVNSDIRVTNPISDPIASQIENLSMGTVERQLTHEKVDSGLDEIEEVEKENIVPCPNEAIPTVHEPKTKSIISSISTEEDTRSGSGNEPDKESLRSSSESSEAEIQSNRDRWRKQFRQLWTSGKWVELGFNNSLVDEHHLKNYLNNNRPSDSGRVTIRSNVSFQGHTTLTFPFYILSHLA